MAFSPAATARERRLEGTVRVWDLAEGRPCGGARSRDGSDPLLAEYPGKSSERGGGSSHDGRQTSTVAGKHGRRSPSIRPEQPAGRGLLLPGRKASPVYHAQPVLFGLSVLPRFHTALSPSASAAPLDRDLAVYRHGQALAR